MDNNNTCSSFSSSSSSINNNNNNSNNSSLVLSEGSKKKKKYATTRSGTTRLSTDPQSVAARERRHRISDRFKILQSLVPGGSKMDTVSMLDEAIHYVKFLKAQILLHQAMINIADNHLQQQQHCYHPNDYNYDNAHHLNYGVGVGNYTVNEQGFSSGVVLELEAEENVPIDDAFVYY